jgi:hypothetical protein
LAAVAKSGSFEPCKLKETMTDRTNLLHKACRDLAKTTTRSASVDLIETIGEAFENSARLYEKRVADAGHSVDVLAATVNFINEVLAHHEVGTDVKWFDTSLDALLELIAPSRRIGPAATRFRALASSILISTPKWRKNMQKLTFKHTRSKGLRLTYDVTIHANRYVISLGNDVLKDAMRPQLFGGNVGDEEATSVFAVSDIEDLVGMLERWSNRRKWMANVEKRDYPES